MPIYMEEINRKIRLMVQSCFPEKGDKLVFGEGKIPPAVMLIGEAPGGQEEQQGHPFVGKAGQNLSGFLSLANLSRQDIYVTNVVKLRPERISPKGTVSNRPPTKAEISAFLPFLAEEIHAVSPGVIVTLGNVPLNAVLALGNNPPSVIGACHGILQHLTIGGDEVDLFPMYHPASVIYNSSLKGVCEEDWKRLNRKLTKIGNRKSEIGNNSLP